jgi:hypothetical protein
MMLSNRSEIRRNFARACARSGTGVHDLLIDEWVDQILEMRDFYERETLRLGADFEARVSSLKRELEDIRAMRALPANVIELKK